ncbi:carotenoid biosynthesis protein [Fulvivirga sedimenti]|uniref:Carotenoid biosynthesis protein n=1 Tax=Fulvivirga sedimenti TaxID=2879465 RepID=A0A9X1KZJ8_9BACT|nr:carotenoid biosynthesis protein [Fulvivirga sedimenti]MCA6074799.1 carotenoid biosynthesis protein [Fulvivirga sedimenti]MCA6075976.1 carotenoid biosynthesis protein [Fulvivirga sedimenti]MCA6077104.1 carotenoid biosynthesis protein [Fulvivirga sedimenti]
MIRGLEIRQELISIPRLTIGIFLVYLFHISALIGVTLGYQNWFIEKTPLNLFAIFCLLAWLFPIDSGKKILAVTMFFSGGMIAEWLGVHYGILFGVYEYGENLGPKIDGVPFFIGINWAVLVLITGVISNRIKVSKWLKVLIGAGLMVLFDLFMEVPAPVFDFWVFEGGIAPLSNYIGWFVVAAFLHTVFQHIKIEGDFLFSLHVYICQLLFFAYFYFYYGL